MRIGVPREIKVLENRVGLTPESAREVVAHGHEVLVEHDAGQGIGMADDDYRHAGATVVDTAREVFDASEMIVKVKEPQADERRMLQPGQVLFTYLHLAPDPEQASDLARERRRMHRVRDRDLARAADCRCSRRCPRSRDAWPYRRARITSRSRMAARACCWAAFPASTRRKWSSSAAASSARTRSILRSAWARDVWVLDRSVDVLRRLWTQFGRPLNTVFSTRDAIERHVTDADLVIGGVLIPGASAPKLVSAAHDQPHEAGLGGRRRRDRPGRVL